MRKLSIIPAPLLLLLAIGVSAEQSGRDIAVQSQNVHFAYQTLSVNGTMTLFEGGEVVGERQISVEQIERPDRDAHDLARITIASPASLRGTRLLSWSSASGDDQQWLYTPRSKRTRRIGSRGRNAGFVSSDFSYEDLLRWQLDSYAYQQVGESNCPAGSCTTVRAVPINRHSNYKQLRVYYDNHFRISQIDYFSDDSAMPSKVLVQQDYAQVGKSWQPRVSVMTDTRRGTETRVDWSDYAIDIGIDERRMQPGFIDD